MKLLKNSVGKNFMLKFLFFTILVLLLFFSAATIFSGETRILSSKVKIKTGQLEHFRKKNRDHFIVDTTSQTLEKKQEESESQIKKTGKNESDSTKITSEKKSDSDLEKSSLKEDNITISWLSDYREACRLGKERQKMTLIYFYDVNKDSPYKDFESESLNHADVKKLLQNYICVRLPLDAQIPSIKENDDADSQEQEEENKFDENAGEIIAAQLDNIQTLSETITHAGGKTQFKQTVIRNENPIRQASFSQRASGRNMGSVARLNDPKTDLLFPDVVKKITLIHQPAFYEMLNTPGLAIIDYEHKDAEFYGDVVSVFPFLDQKTYALDETKKMLTLPPGTLTQRSVIFAVRIHPDHPKSADGELNNLLVAEAKSHSEYQAKIHLQGHHHWDRRFQRITDKLPAELWASEVCAESWPSQHLLESAIECVRCWRFSEGHWSAVVAEHPYYGYDMKLGVNGVWYATGIFGKWRRPSPLELKVKN
ncbi:MAG: hypothetical protein LBT05_10015 [Planctomycetaceae bacterium]|jgi:hypothetical protein|nr:hypothetical protein [Planctomycetaceae bacterium]